MRTGQVFSGWLTMGTLIGEEVNEIHITGKTS